MRMEFSEGTAEQFMTSNREDEFPNLTGAKKERTALRGGGKSRKLNWQRYGDLNPSFRRERAASWARLDDSALSVASGGDGCKRAEPY